MPLIVAASLFVFAKCDEATSDIYMYTYIYIYSEHEQLSPMYIYMQDIQECKKV